jgi:hypothetical protein
MPSGHTTIRVSTWERHEGAQGSFVGFRTARPRVLSPAMPTEQALPRLSLRTSSATASATAMWRPDSQSLNFLDWRGPPGLEPGMEVLQTGSEGRCVRSGWTFAGSCNRRIPTRPKIGIFIRAKPLRARHARRASAPPQRAGCAWIIGSRSLGAALVARRYAAHGPTCERLREAATPTARWLVPAACTRPTRVARRCR